MRHELFQDSSIKEIYDTVASQQDLDNGDFYLYSNGKYENTVHYKDIF